MSQQFLTVDQILAAPDIQERVVDCPEWGGSIKIQSLTMAAQQRIHEAATVKGELQKDRLQMLLFIHCVVEPKFTDEHYEALRQKSAVPIMRVLAQLTDLSGMSKEAGEKAQATFPEGVPKS